MALKPLFHCLEGIKHIRQELVENTKDRRAALANYEKSLKTWAKRDLKHWGAKNLEFNFGSVAFRMPPSAISEVLETETIIERVRLTGCLPASAR